MRGMAVDRGPQLRLNWGGDLLLDLPKGGGLIDEKMRILILYLKQY